ncbi:FeoA family protein [Maridesulfovibrio hydrothermalis]|uniref:FeoA family protein n=1 Tax=Maridesulfovibrio hydrothermalis AM13 = DSM 14728 TaxID=1121451 RepID=L0RBI8_9BACT|nr:FeoA family protein [Maridesulfovibrio hydrothermalis]CCO22901.1 FeoA family protein [Maridesulfovibrio hydrothermalis AM13 = DSM 14728]
MFNKFDFFNREVFSGRRKQRGHGGGRRRGKNCNMRGTSLLDIPIGSRATIKRHYSEGAVRQRLLDLGFVPGREVEVVRVATLGCPLELKVAGYCVTLRRTEACEIEVDNEQRS